MSILDGTDLPEVLALQEATRDALPADKKMYILPQGTSYFQNLLTRQTGLMVGIHAEGKLIAQMVLMGPMNLSEAIARHVITGNDVVFHHAALTDSVIIFKSMASHPDWRGNDLANALMSFALELPFTQVVVHVFAQVSVGNKRSWDVFARQGFGIVAAALDPKDGQPRFIFQKPAFGFDFDPAIIADEADPVEDFSAIVNLTQREALVGTPDETAAGKLAFMRNCDILNLMPTMARMSART
ncbi:MAG: GNAT family N-acetyltransferase [Alphaproteobacteria bacterium]